MSLTLLPTDLIEPICFLVDGHDIARLHSCGNRALSRLLFASTRDIAFSMKRFDPFPILAFQLPLLQSLSVKTMNIRPGCPLRLQERRLEAPTSWKTLQTLELSFAQSFAVFQTSTFPHCAPNLTTLRCLASKIPLSVLDFENLPQSLKILELMNFPLNSYYAPCIGFGMLLPPKLEYFKSNSIRFTAKDDDIISMETINWPTSLKTLELLNSCPMALSLVYPPQLEVFSCHTLDEQPVPEVSISVLPGTMRDLYIYGRGPIFILDGLLPLGMTNFCAKLQVNAASLLKQLPKTLIDFSEAMEWEEKYFLLPFHEYLPNHEFWSLDDGVERDIETFQLPKGLKRLSMLVDDQEWLFSRIPHSVTTLDISDYRAQNMLHLPPRLTSFSIIPIGDLPPMSIEGWKSLPKSVTQLNVSTTQFASMECFDVLPEGLKILNLLIANHMLQEAEIFQHLPKSIIDLRVEVMDATPVCDVWRRDIAQFKALERLDWSYYGNHIPGKNSDPSLSISSFFTSLPPGLKELFMTLSENDEFPLDCFAGLPKKLESLRLTEGELPPASLTDAHFAHLPSSIMYLRVRVSSITPAIYEHLPPGIMFDVLHKPIGSDWVSAREKYFSNPIWDGTQ